MSAPPPPGRWDALLGPLETRAAIAAWLRRSRAVRCDPEQLLIASSVQQILALLARLLVEPGQRLLVEDPSYIGFHAAFLAEGRCAPGHPGGSASAFAPTRCRSHRRLKLGPPRGC